jgi:hypothetical protein
MNALFNRLYSDYAMPSRLAVYEHFVRAAQEAGYTQTSVRGFVNSSRSRTADEKFVIHRHDIDTDLHTTRKLFKLEKKYNIRSSYYFRLSTLDFRLMAEIEEYGSEASYHYEELANFAKRNKIRCPATIVSRLPEIRGEFLTNFKRIEQQLGKKMTTVAAHGDFTNRRLNLRNTEILNDGLLRTLCGIECETYDQSLMSNVGIYIADRPHPQYFHPIPPVNAIGQHRNIYLLTHPRQLETNWRENTKDNLFRCYEGLVW